MFMCVAKGKLRGIQGSCRLVAVACGCSIRHMIAMVQSLSICCDRLHELQHMWCESCDAGAYHGGPQSAFTNKAKDRPHHRIRCRGDLLAQGMNAVLGCSVHFAAANEQMDKMVHMGWVDISAGLLLLPL